MDGIDWSYWANLDVVDYRDACILSCGYDPKVIAGHALPEGLDAAIQQRETIAKSHLGGALPAYATDADRYHERSAASGVKLAEFRAWGRSLPMPLTFPCGFPEPPRPVRAEPSNEELARVARMDLWSQRELAELCTGWIPGRHGMNEAEAIAINEASEAIARGTLSGSLAFIPRNDADSAAIMYGTARHYVPAVAAEWAATRFDAFPAKLLAAVRERVQKPQPAIGTLQQEKEASPKRANTLYRIIAALAKAAKIDIAEGSDGATMIAAAVRDARFDSPDEKAIRNILKEVRKQ